jgi:hypothetical protein
MEKLLPDVLKDLWQAVDEHAFTGEHFYYENVEDEWHERVDPESDPVSAVDQISEALRPRGFLFGRFAVEAEDEEPQHIVHDFEPVFQRLRALRVVQVWEDEWLWGHQVFQRT